MRAPTAEAPATVQRFTAAITTGLKLSKRPGKRTGGSCLHDRINAVCWGAFLGCTSKIEGNDLPARGTEITTPPISSLGTANRFDYYKYTHFQRIVSCRAAWLREQPSQDTTVNLNNVNLRLFPLDFCPPPLTRLTFTFT